MKRDSLSTRTRQRRALIAQLALSLCACAGLGYTSAAVVVPAGSSVRFDQANANWSLVAGSHGSITPNGLYTAPAHVDPVHVVNGVQVLPTDHIYYAPITNLPLIPNEPTILHLVWTYFGSSGMSILPAFHDNVLDDTMPTTPMSFWFTPGNDAQYQFMSGHDPESPYVGVPDEFIQSGTYQSYLLEGDRHILGTNIDSGVTYEIYNAWPQGYNTHAPSTNAASGVHYGLSVNPYDIGPGTVAGGQLLAASLITADEIRTHKINHVSFFTMPNGAIAGGSKCGAPPHIVECFIWPASARAFVGGDYIPYGARLRLKASVDTVNNPATGKPFSPEAQAVFRAWKDYGVMLSDGGMTGQAEVDVDVLEDHQIAGVMGEVSQSKASDGLLVGQWKHWDIVDESRLELAASSGQVNQANPYVHPVFATAIATDKTTGKRTAYPIVLQGVTVGVPNSVETIQSGTQLQMKSWVRGSLNDTVRWSMSPALGTLTASGLYTAPAVTAPTATLLTATSIADPEASTTVRVVVFPAGGVYMRLGWLAKPWTDSKGHVWQPEFTGRLGYTGTTYGLLSAAHTPDWQIWEYAVGNWGGDYYFRLHVPNGRYTITLYHAMPPGPKGDMTLAPHRSEFAIECMGRIVDPAYDLAVAGGGRRGVPLTYTMTATVTDGVLEFAERALLGGTVSTTAPPSLNLNAFSIVRE